MSDTTIKSKKILPIPLTDNSAYNDVTRERNNYSAQDLSNIERDKKKTKTDIDTSTDYNNDARNNDKYEEPTSDSTTQQTFTSNPASNERTPQDSSNYCAYNL